VQNQIGVSRELQAGRRSSSVRKGKDEESPTIGSPPRVHTQTKRNLGEDAMLDDLTTRGLTRSEGGATTRTPMTTPKRNRRSKRSVARRGTNGPVQKREGHKHQTGRHKKMPTGIGKIFTIKLNTKEGRDGGRRGSISSFKSKSLAADERWN